MTTCGLKPALPAQQGPETQPTAAHPRLRGSRKMAAASHLLFWVKRARWEQLSSSHTTDFKWHTSPRARQSLPAPHVLGSRGHPLPQTISAPTDILAPPSSEPALRLSLEPSGKGLGAPFFIQSLFGCLTPKLLHSPLSVQLFKVITNTPGPLSAPAAHPPALQRPRCL